MGLDRDDAIIRRRMRQKMEFVADLTADVRPTDAELRTFVTDHPARFRARAALLLQPRLLPADVEAAERSGAATSAPGSECRNG